MSWYNLVSLLGIIAMMGFGWLFSWDKKNINFRVIIWGTLFQFVFALVIFVFPAGTKIFLVLNDGVLKLIEASAAGPEFLFGRLGISPGDTNQMGEKSMGFFLAFQALPTIVFFSALMSLLYYFNILPFLIRIFARFFTRSMKISGAESLAAASNIFVGVESSLTIKPHLESMTRSELGTVLTAGMATVASNVMAIYVFSLQKTFPTIAGHLISASILSAPAAIVMAKIIMPENGTPDTMGEDIHPHYEKDSGVFEAIINGSNQGVKLIIGISALLLSVLGLVTLADMIIGGVADIISCCVKDNFNWTLRGIFGYIFYPFTLAMGVPPGDAYQVSQIIGERIIVTEVASYQDLARAISKGLIKEKRSIMIAAYALCGFAHIASLSIFIGGIAGIAPSRTADLAKVGPRALLAATLATLMTGAVAGIFFTETPILKMF